MRSAWQTIHANSWVCENVLSGTNTAPTRVTANAATASSTLFGMRMPTRDPLPIPAARSPFATAADRVSAST